MSFYLLILKSVKVKLKIALSLLLLSILSACNDSNNVDELIQIKVEAKALQSTFTNISPMEAQQAHSTASVEASQFNIRVVNNKAVLAPSGNSSLVDIDSPLANLAYPQHKDFSSTANSRINNKSAKKQ